jgi:hypothetical protein
LSLIQQINHGYRERQFFINMSAFGFNWPLAHLQHKFLYIQVLQTLG